MFQLLVWSVCSLRGLFCTYEKTAVLTEYFEIVGLEEVEVFLPLTRLPISEYTVSPHIIGCGLDRKGAVSVLKTVGLFSVFLGSLLALSHELAGSWDFLSSTYGFMLSVPELTPNMGIFW